MIIDGKKIAAELREELKKKIIEFKATYKSIPGLTVILIGEDPAIKIYVKNKQKHAKDIGINSEIIKYHESVDEKTVLDKISKLNNDKKISGILEYEGKIIWDQTKPDGTPKKQLNIKHILKLGWEPKITLEEGIRITLKEYQKTINFPI